MAGALYLLLRHTRPPDIAYPLESSFQMRKLEHTTDIQAPAATVWQVLTATEQYEQWNPFIPCLSGVLRVGQRLTVTIRAGRRSMTFRPIVETVEDGALLRWRGRLRGVPGLFDGTHELRVEATAPGTSRFTQREAFRGVLVPLMRRLLDDTDTGFAAMNAALKARATSRVAQAAATTA